MGENHRLKLNHLLSIPVKHYTPYQISISLSRRRNMKPRLLLTLMPFLSIGFVVILIAQQPPPMRLHRVTQRGELIRVPANVANSFENRVIIEVQGEQRVIRSNGIPNHNTGTFPNSGNPNRISEQDHQYKIPANPKIADEPTPLQGEFGVAVNGVPFDPGAGEFYDGEPGWQYEPLSGAIALGIDVSHAHVQPNGKYHYHGLPTGLLDSIELTSSKHSPLVGWAADGFPIYAVYGYEDPLDPKSEIQPLKSSYQLKKGQRPGGNAPTGRYDGTFVRDYEYVAGSGDLDACNGRTTITPEFPDGTYAYFLTEQWPVIPRIWKGNPSQDFLHRGVVRGGNPIAGRPQTQMRQGRGNQNTNRPGGFGQRNGFGGPPRPGQILPDFLKRALNLTEEQEDRLDKLQATVDGELEKILSTDQLKQLRGMGPPEGNRFPQRQSPRANPLQNRFNPPQR